MRSAAQVSWIVPALALAAGGASTFKPYPGATVDQKATKEAKEMAEGNVTIYTTRDPFEKVHAFYKPLGKEYRMPSPGEPVRLRSGGTLKEAYFILDGAPDIVESKAWFKIQRPYAGRPKEGFNPEARFFEDQYEDVRDVTAIVLVRR